MGATGTLDIDGMTIELVPVGGQETTNLIVNGGFELGDPAPDLLGRRERRSPDLPGNNSPAALELSQPGSRAMAGVAIPIDRFEALEVSMAVRCAGIRGADGAGASLFFLDEFGKPVQAPQTMVPIVRWSGSFPWRRWTRSG